MEWVLTGAKAVAWCLLIHAEASLSLSFSGVGSRGGAGGREGGLLCLGLGVQMYKQH